MPCEYINALIAAGAALAGVLLSLLGNWLLSYMQHGHESKMLLRSKYEELAILVVDSISDYRKILTAESNLQLLGDSEPISAQKASVLARLYFPELVKTTDGYLVALIAFRNSCAKAAAANPRAPQINAISSSPDVEKAQSVLEKAKNTLESQIQACSKTYTRA